MRQIKGVLFNGVDCISEVSYVSLYMLEDGFPYGIYHCIHK